MPNEQTREQRIAAYDLLRRLYETHPLRHKRTSVEMCNLFEEVAAALQDSTPVAAPAHLPNCDFNCSCGYADSATAAPAPQAKRERYWDEVHCCERARAAAPEPPQPPRPKEQK